MKSAVEPEEINISISPVVEGIVRSVSKLRHRVRKADASQLLATYMQSGMDEVIHVIVHVRAVSPRTVVDKSIVWNDSSSIQKYFQRYVHRKEQENPYVLLHDRSMHGLLVSPQRGTRDIQSPFQQLLDAITMDPPHRKYHEHSQGELGRLIRREFPSSQDFLGKQAAPIYRELSAGAREGKLNLDLLDSLVLFYSDMVQVLDEVKADQVDGNPTASSIKHQGQSLLHRLPPGIQARVRSDYESFASILVQDASLGSDHRTVSATKAWLSEMEDVCVLVSMETFPSSDDDSLDTELNSLFQRYQGRRK